jgi:glycosyltransferase involved in cell wall biosynthesis
MKLEGPFFSIVIPTYNRPDQLAACLEGCSRLTYPHDRFEVIVVDDGGITPLDSVVGTFSDRMAVRLISQSNAGPASARNRGATEAQGDFLAFTDDDCTPSQGWLHALAEAFNDGWDCAVGGKTVNILTDNIYSTTSQLLLDYLYEYYNRSLDGAKFFASNNLAFPREEFLKSGGFNSGYTLPAAEDRELCDRWVSQGRRLRYVPEAVVSHAHPLALRTLWRQHLNYGKGAFSFHRMRADREGESVKIEPLSFYINLFVYPFKFAPWGRAVVLSHLLLVTQVANACGYFMERIPNRCSQ